MKSLPLNDLQRTLGRPPRDDASNENFFLRGASMAGKTGRRPLPTAVKKAHGERRSGRLNPREPQPDLGAPPKPLGLGKVASAEWDRLVQITTSTKVLTLADGPALEATVCAYEDYRQARDVVQKEGAFYATTNAEGQMLHKAHPATRVAAESWRRYVMGLALFGLSPATRTKVQQVQQREQDDVELWLAGGREA
jgi:P27 family predicted phage terminase small subunit